MMLKVHGLIHSLVSFTSPSENELHLVYNLRSPSSRSSRQEVAIVLLFVPNTRQLADVQVSGLPAGCDLSDAMGAHVQANDVPGLIAAILQRARAELWPS